MSDTMLHGVLRMPPNCWSGTELDVTQRHSRYIQASERIYELEDKLAQVERERDEANARLEQADKMLSFAHRSRDWPYSNDDFWGRVELFLTNQNKD